MIFLVSGSTPSWRKSLRDGKESLLVPIRTQFQNTKGIIATFIAVSPLLIGVALDFGEIKTLKRQYLINSK